MKTTIKIGGHRVAVHHSGELESITAVPKDGVRPHVEVEEYDLPADTEERIDKITDEVMRRRVHVSGLDIKGNISASAEFDPKTVKFEWRTNKTACKHPANVVRLDTIGGKQGEIIEYGDCGLCGAGVTRTGWRYESGIEYSEWERPPVAYGKRFVGENIPDRHYFMPANRGGKTQALINKLSRRLHKARCDARHSEEARKNQVRVAVLRVLESQKLRNALRCPNPHATIPELCEWAARLVMHYTHTGMPTFEEFLAGKMGCDPSAFQPGGVIDAAMHYIEDLNQRLAKQKEPEFIQHKGVPVEISRGGMLKFANTVIALEMNLEDRDQRIGKLNSEALKYQTSAKQTHDLSSFLMSLDCGYPRCDAEHPAGMDLGEALKAYITELRRVLGERGRLNAHFKKLIDGREYQLNEIKKSLGNAGFHMDNDVSLFVRVKELTEQRDKARSECRELEETIVRLGNRGPVIGRTKRIRVKGKKASVRR